MLWYIAFRYPTSFFSLINCQRTQRIKYSHSKAKSYWKLYRKKMSQFEMTGFFERVEISLLEVIDEYCYKLHQLILHVWNDWQNFNVSSKRFQYTYKISKIWSVLKKDKQQQEEKVHILKNSVVFDKIYSFQFDIMILN